jgi:rubrerythrin
MLLITENRRSVMETQKAFEAAIAMETRSLSFYRALSTRAKDRDTKRVFELLAKDEAGHLNLFCSMYQGNEEDLVRLLAKNYINTMFDPKYCSMLNSMEVDSMVEEALQTALGEELACIEFYTVYMETVRDPKLQDLFARILEETHKHCEIISEEYLRHLNVAAATSLNVVCGNS